ncbi:MAG: DNA-binding response regulator [Chloroflexi bacterium]|nr:MAG: DNA-binding response regulator [Chloroflexota bacterium]
MLVRPDIELATWTHGEGRPLIAPPHAPWFTIESTRRVAERMGMDRHPLHLRGQRTVRYDARGMGQSSGHMDAALDVQIEDLGAVIDATAAGPVALMAMRHAGPVAIAYTAANPQRVSQLILWCTYASGPDDFFDAKRFRAIQRLLDLDWDLFLSTAAYELVGWSSTQAPELVQILRDADLHPADIVRGWQQLARNDVTPLLAQIRVPTLVLERADGRSPGPNVARRLAGAIPGAQLALLPGSSPLPFAETPGLIQRTLSDTLDPPRPMALGPIARRTGIGARRPDAAYTPTPRESEVLQLVARGLSNHDIAAELSISAATVRNHLTALFGKLKVRNRTAAVARARDEGLLE